LIQPGLYQKNTLIKHFTAVINAVWISIIDPVEFFKIQSDPVPNCRIRLDRDPETRSCSTVVCSYWQNKFRTVFVSWGKI